MTEDSAAKLDRAILDAGAALAEPTHIPGGGSFVVVPDGYRVDDIEHFRQAPSRPQAIVHCEAPEAFAAYYNRFKDDARSMAFACTAAFRVQGILDWHRPGDIVDPGFGDHRVLYTAPRSEEWKIWTGADGEAMDQADFARFIEDNVKDIREPAGADVLEVSRQLEVTRKVEFASALRLSDGQREFTYSEEVDGSTRRGQLKVPDEFVLGIPVFLAGPLYAVIARLRYRIAGGKLKLWYDLLNPHLVACEAFAEVVAKIRADTGHDVLMAMPST